MKVLLFQLVLMAVFTGTAFSHGILAGSSLEKGLAVYAEYDDGEPAAYSEVEIFFDKEAIPFQTGRTDKNGRFLFLPDREGPWQAVINDGMGHKAVVRMAFHAPALEDSVKGEGSSPDPSPPLGSGSTLLNAAGGIGIILILCFLGKYLARRSNTRQ